MKTINLPNDLEEALTKHVKDKSMTLEQLAIAYLSARVQIGWKTNAELDTMDEEKLMEMLFIGSDQADITRRQAQYQLERNQSKKVTKFQMRVAALSAFATLLAAIAAIASACAALHLLH